MNMEVSVALCRPREGTQLLASDPDLGLMQKARANDPSAITLLWNKYQARLCSYFLKNVRQREEAEDLASETLLAALAQLSSFRGDRVEGTGSESKQNCTFQTYVYAI